MADRTFDFKDKLDFNNIDLTAPDKVVEDILSQLRSATNGLIRGSVQAYEGPIQSYKKMNFSSIAEALVSDEVDIQQKLGVIGQEEHKFECFLFTPEYDRYRYRVFFLQYNAANYPVKIVIDDSVAESAFPSSNAALLICSTRDELERCVYTIFNSPKMVSVMQELIRINQIKKSEKSDENNPDNGALFTRVY